jgi:hypothetical protein
VKRSRGEISCTKHVAQASSLQTQYGVNCANVAQASSLCIKKHSQDGYATFDRPAGDTSTNNAVEGAFSTPSDAPNSAIYNAGGGTPPLVYYSMRVIL